jgi:hypothetical protein
MVPQADELWMVCFYTELRGRASVVRLMNTFNYAYRQFGAPRNRGRVSIDR